MDSMMNLMLLGLALISGSLFGAIFMTLYKKNRKAAMALLVSGVGVALVQIYLLRNLSILLSAGVFVIYVAIAVGITLILKKTLQKAAGSQGS